MSRWRTHSSQAWSWPKWQRAISFSFYKTSITLETQTSSSEPSNEWQDDPTIPQWMWSTQLEWQSMKSQLVSQFLCTLREAMMNSQRHWLTHPELLIALFSTWRRKSSLDQPRKQLLSPHFSPNLKSVAKTPTKSLSSSNQLSSATSTACIFLFSPRAHFSKRKEPSLCLSHTLLERTLFRFR